MDLTTKTIDELRALYHDCAVSLDPLTEAQPMPREEAKTLKAALKDEIRKRGVPIKADVRQGTALSRSRRQTVRIGRPRTREELLQERAQIDAELAQAVN